MAKFIPRVLVITGASSGLGAALALHYAQPGITLGLLGRNEARLNEVAQKCQSKGATVKTGIIDVENRALMQEWLLAFDSAHSVDLIIANAGISAGTGGVYEGEDQIRRIFSVNIDGVLNSVLPLLMPIRARKRGQIAIISSLAGIRGLPSCPAYSASKMAVRGLGEGLRGVLKKDDIVVSVVCPGYIRTPMTQTNDFPMPFIMDASKAAQIIARGLSANRARIAFPQALFLPLWWLSCLPVFLTDAFFAALPSKSVMEKK